MNKTLPRALFFTKRITTAIFMIAALTLMLVCAASCDYLSPVLTSITAEYTGDDVEVGGAINKDEVVVVAHFSDRTIKVVKNFDLDYDFSAAGQCEVLVSYGKADSGFYKTCTFYVTVVEKSVTPEPPTPPNPPEPPVPTVTLTSITAVYNGENIKIGGTLNNADIALTAYYSDETNKAVTDFTVSGFSSDTAGEKEVTVTYIENDVTKTCAVTVTVEEDAPTPPNPPEPPVPTVTLTSITAVYNGENIKVGGTLNNEDIVVTVYYSDDSSKTVTNFTVGNFSSAAAGTQTVNVSYTEDGITKECSISVTIIDDSPIVVSNSNLSVHFLELGNQYTGDCVYIKAGDTDILIDAGSRESSANTIAAYLNNYVTDGKLEYVIATHAHQDHIAGFVGSSSSKSILDRFQCDTLIRYAQSKSTAQVRKDFEAKCDEQAEKGVNVITALDCINNANNAHKVYDLTEDGSITMEVLEHNYYAETSSDENDHSVCVMITQGDNHYLFTGDLEEKGEASLVQKNPNLPEMVLFKGGHHGSYTASNEVLLQKIKPQYVCICCCAGNVEYLTTTPQNLNHSFPAQEMIDRIAKYTDNVYVTTLGKIKWNGTKWANDGYESMNGNITFSCVNGEISLVGSNNSLKLKDTEWFKTNRTCPKEWLDDEAA